MKTASKLTKYLRLLLCLALVFALTACGKDKASDSETETDTELTLGNIKLIIDKSFYPTTGKHDGEDTKYFKKNAGKVALIANVTYKNHACNDAAVNFLCENIAETYSIAIGDIQRNKIDDDHYFLSWNGTEDGKALTCGAYVAFVKDSQIAIYETADGMTVDEIRAEATATAQTAVFIGKEPIVKDNYVLENKNLRVTITDSYDSPQLQDASSIDPSSDTVYVESGTIAVYIKNTDTFNRGDSYFKIAAMKDQAKDIAEIAKEKSESDPSGNSELERTLTEATIAEIWPSLADSDIAAEPVYKLTIVIKDNPFTAETYYLNINNTNYAASVLYPLGDKEAHDELLNLFYQVEFLDKAAE